MAIDPLFARVLLQREKLKTSIIIPDIAAKRNAPCIGTVLKTGDTCEDRIKGLVGKKVLFGQHAGTWINEDGTAVADPLKAEFFMCMEEDLLGVIE
ncbi:MAG: hypothetical protein C4523_02465 [Myxococcales bacterium]|nr:MAG: hypothetical protein C4523_02465 [Myxococcales bacterium]